MPGKYVKSLLSNVKNLQFVYFYDKLYEIHNILPKIRGLATYEVNSDENDTLANVASNIESFHLNNYKIFNKDIKFKNVKEICLEWPS